MLVKATTGVLCQKQLSRAGTSNYIPQLLWDVITCPCPWYFPIWWKQYCSVSQFLAIRLQQNFAHTMTEQLLWYVQTFVSISVVIGNCSSLSFSSILLKNSIQSHHITYFQLFCEVELSIFMRLLLEIHCTKVDILILEWNLKSISYLQ